MDFNPDAAEIMARLAPTLDRLESIRVEALARRVKARWATALVMGIGLIGGLTALSSDALVFAMILFGASVGLGILVYQKVHGGACAAYRSLFKEKVFGEATKLVAPGMRYFPDSMVPQHTFERSGLFKTRIDRYRGEDRFEGKVGATDLLFSELHVERKEERRDSKGKSETHWVTVFRGVYLIADFHKHFRCRVSIEPDFAEANFGWLGRKLQGISSDLVRLENPEFERAFKVSASDAVEARYLLTPDMQERFLALRNRWSSGVCAALLDSNLHIAIPLRDDWFEPNLKLPANASQPVAAFLSQLLALLYIPEKLDLNTRIWTKE